MTFSIARLARPLSLGIALLALLTAPASGQWNGPDADGDIFYDGGAVGVGTDTPARTLHVDGYVRTDGLRNFTYLFFEDRTGSGGQWRQAVVSDGRFQLDRTDSYGVDYLSFDHAGGARTEVSWTFGDRVGIGTGAPSSPLGFHQSAGDKIDLYSGGGFHGFGIKNSTLAAIIPSGHHQFSVYRRDSGGDAEMAYIQGNGDGYFRGDLGVGTKSPNEKLTVAGNVLAEEVIVKSQSEWSDYVFEESYDLPTLAEVSQFIDKKGHLPNVPSAEKVKRNGLHLGQMDATLLRKVEELTLYAIEQKERADRQAHVIDSLKAANVQLQRENEGQQTQLNRLRKQVREGQNARARQRRQIEQLQQQVRRLLRQKSSSDEP